MKYFILVAGLLIFSLISSYTSEAQSPGLIVQPRIISGSTFLNPNGDRFTSTTAAGFNTSDVTQSELPFKIIPRYETEPVGDNNGGSTGGSTDFLQGTNGSGFYAFYDGTNIIFRFRVGGVSKGSRGYSILIDTDLKIGNTGFYADPNYVSPSSQRSGNPGFELEILYAQNKAVQILNVDGTVDGTVIASYPENTHSQISVALSQTSGNADYFIDFGVPVSALGIGTQYIRLVGTTGVSASSALNNNASDVWGINDIPTKQLLPNWFNLIKMQCGVGVTALSANGPGICICTPPPVINAPINPGTNVPVTGIWYRASNLYSSQTIISVFKNSLAIGTVTANTGVPWSFTVPSLAVDDTVYAMAQSAPESMCYESNRVIVACSSVIPPASISCATIKGMRGTIPLGAVVDIYEIRHSMGNPALINPYSTKISTGLVYTDDPTIRTFSYYGTNSQVGTPCSSGQDQLSNVNYMVIVNQGGCYSQPLFMCITSSGWNEPTLSPTLILNTPIYSNQTTLNGSGGSTAGAQGKIYRLYQNGVYKTYTTSTTGSFTFTGLNLQTGDKLYVFEQVSSSTCQTFTPTYTVQCFLPPVPTIVSNNGTIPFTATSINGYSSVPGSGITLFRGSSPTGTGVGSTTVNNAGEWEITGVTLTGGETYYAVQTSDGCSVTSTAVNITSPLTPCGSISGSYDEDATAINGIFSSSFTGSVRLYRDGVFLKAVNVNNATSWSVPVNSDIIFFTDKLSARDSISITTLGSSGTIESDVCDYRIISCAVPPTPAASPATATITAGETVTFNVASSSQKVLYTVVDNTNDDFTSSSFGNNGSLSITTYPFITPGTYNLKIAADNISAPECRTTSDVVVTVNSVALPVKFINFSAKEITNSVQLKWHVANEINVKYYLVERSTDCSNNFNAIGKVNYQSTTNSNNIYNFTDLSFSGNVCYRIVQVSTDGKISYSNIIPVTSSKKAFLYVNPNPAKNKATLFIPSETERAVTIELDDMNSRRVLRKTVKLHPGNNAVTLYDLNFARGTYIVKVYDFTSFQFIKLVLN